MTNHEKITRRNFLKSTAAATAVSALSVGDSIVPFVSKTNGAENRFGSLNEKIQLGIIGCGHRGRAVLKGCLKYSDVVLVGACDVWKERLQMTVEEYKTTCKGYRDFRELLNKKEIDAVIIATPPHWHALMAIAACEAGKDFYLEKPMTLHLGESLAVYNAVKKSRVITQIGTQIHSTENYRRVVEFIRSGNLGDIGVVRTFNVMNVYPRGIGKSNENKIPDGFDWDMWVGPAPMRPYNRLITMDAFNHSFWLDYSGGWTPGMAPHIIDLPIWALELDFPLITSSAGGRYFLDDDGDVYDHHEVLWQYPKLTLTWMSSLTNSYGFDLHGEATPKRRLGIYFHGSNGTLYANYDLFKIVPEGDRMNGKTEQPPPTLPGTESHERDWLDGVKSRKQPSCSVLYHIKVDLPITLSLLSLKLQRSIRFDPKTLQVVNDREARKAAIPQYRSPWKFPSGYLNW
ncbi:MAG: Gfo/Idh/MocA family protein [Limisphaerales bacterium]